MSTLSIEDRRWVEKRHRAVRSMWLFGWIAVVLPLVAGVVLWRRHEVLVSRAYEEAHKAHAKLAEKAQTGLERAMADEIFQQDNALVYSLSRGGSVRLVQPLVGAMIIGVILLLAARNEQRLLRLLEPLEKNKTSGAN